MTVQTESGDVDANVATDRLTTRTDSGDTDLRLGTAPTLLAATSDSGGDVDIRCRTVKATGSTRSRIRRKDINLALADRATHAIQVGSGSGDISVSGR